MTKQTYFYNVTQKKEVKNKKLSPIDIAENMSARIFQKTLSEKEACFEKLQKELKSKIQLLEQTNRDLLLENKYLRDLWAEEHTRY